MARVVRRGGDEVLHRPAERRLDGDFELLLGGDDVGNGALDAAAELGIFLRLQLQVAHRIAVAVEAVFEIFIKFEVVGVVGDGGVAVDVLLRELLPRTGELA